MTLLQKKSDKKKDRSYWLTLPMLVPDISDPESKNDEAFVQRHDRFLNLPRNIKEKLASVKTSQKIQAIGQKYQFELLRLANITRLIREYYFGEVRFEDFVAEIEKRMAVSPFTAQEITRYLKSEIIDWDPWAEYVAKLPKMTVREMIERKLKITDTEITAGYVELRDSEELEDPTIKNWIQDYISHLGYEKHSQMDRTQYLFHSENGKNLSSQDREKLGIILKSFDENIPLPVDEENGEIVFDGIAPTSPQPSHKGGGDRPLPKNPQPTPHQTINNFIKPYAPTQQPQRPVQSVSTQNIIKPNPAPPVAKISYKVTTSVPEPLTQPTSPQPSPYKGEGAHPEIDKYFNAPEIPEIKIHSMTEHNEPKVAPQANIQRPAPTSLQPSPYKGEGERTKYKIIDPFEPRIVEPRLDGNIVDLSRE